MKSAVNVDLAYAAAFVEARLAEDDDAARAATAERLGTWRPVWVLASDAARIVDTDGMLIGGTQVRAEAEHIARQDPASVLRGVAAKRAIVGACTRAAEAVPDGPAAVLALAVLEAMSTEWEHPERPFVADWTIRPGVLLRKALEAQGKTVDSILGADRIIEGTLRIDAMHAHWIADELGTSADMWLNAQRLYDAAILRGAKDTSEEHGDDG